MNPIDALYLKQPREVSIETLAFCNAACGFCPYPTLDRKGVEMPSALVYRLINEMQSWQHPFFVSPFKVNEPLLDSRLHQFCEAITRSNALAYVRLFTNASPLVEKHLDWIAALPRIEHVWVSLNEVESSKYYDTMKLPFDVTVKRLDMLHKWIADHRFPHVVVVARVTDREHIDIESLGDREFLRYCRSRWPYFVTRLTKRDAWIDYTTATPSVIPQAGCARWFELSILSTGVVSLCCMDGTGEFAIGDIKTRGLLDVYNQPHLLERRRHAITRNGINPCERCTY